MLLAQVVTVSFADGHEFTDFETDMLRQINSHRRNIDDRFTAENQRNAESLREYLQTFGLTSKAMSHDLKHITPYGLMELNLP